MIIAELSCNHNGSINNAREIMRRCADSVDAIKLQCFKPESLTIDAPLTIEGGQWDGRRLWDLYEQAAMPWEWIGELFEHGASLGVEVFSSVYCLEGLRFLERLGCPRYKIASFEIAHMELIEAVGATKKAVIASLGAATPSDTLAALKTLTLAGCKDISFLHCVSSYPAPTNSLELYRINELRSWLNGRVKVGFSDHTQNGVPHMAVAAGAELIERHVKRDGDTHSPDAAFSTDALLMEHYCGMYRQAKDAMAPVKSRSEAHKFKRSIYAVADIAEGEPFTRDNVRVIRPGFGMHPRMFDAVLESHATADIKRGEPITFRNADTIGG